VRSNRTQPRNLGEGHAEYGPFSNDVEPAGRKQKSKESARASRTGFTASDGWDASVVNVFQQAAAKRGLVTGAA